MPGTPGITDLDDVDCVAQEVYRFELSDGSGVSSGVHPGLLAFRRASGLRLLHRYPRGCDSLAREDLHELLDGAVVRADGD